LFMLAVLLMVRVPVGAHLLKGLLERLAPAGLSTGKVMECRCGTSCSVARIWVAEREPIPRNRADQG